MENSQSNSIQKNHSHKSGAIRKAVKFRRKSFKLESTKNGAENSQVNKLIK